MWAKWTADLTECVTAASDLAAEGEAPEFVQPLMRMEEAAKRVGEAWSGSNLGYQSNVYYSGFAKRPAGAHFSREWGFIGMFQGTIGDWQEMPRDAVRAHILELAGDPDVEQLEARAETARESLSKLKERATSVISAVLRDREDEYIADMQAKIRDLTVPTRDQLQRLQMRAASTVTRDGRAIEGGWQSASHQEVLAEATACRVPYTAAQELAALCSNAAEHMQRAPAEPPLMPVRQMGTKIFVGHGGSLQWRVLKDFIQDTLGLHWDEFNRVPVAGITNVGRLQEMLDEASVAFLVLTAEDERTSGATVARQNVVHEAGLFQGRLGFDRAIVMLEDGCDAFSNINGLGQIRFPAGRIETSFEEVRRVLIREGLLGAPGSPSLE